jgi:hypothetical protein
MVGAIGSLNKSDAEFASYIMLAPGSTAQRIEGTVNVSGGIVIGSVSAHVDSIYIESGAQPFGFTNSEVVRIAAGSPASWVAFSNLAQSFSIENLGSSVIYFDFNNAIDLAGSNTILLENGDYQSFNLQVGSISVTGSGATSPEFQMIGLR